MYRDVSLINDLELQLYMLTTDSLGLAKSDSSRMFIID